MSVEREMASQSAADNERYRRWKAQKDDRDPNDWDEEKGEWRPQYIPETDCG